ncbi:hypothetical protein Btru_071656 [Bulinus truncatus]|nr:hypothetical protein Btru_071656 [Bulinus truncatus]
MLILSMLHWIMYILISLVSREVFATSITLNRIDNSSTTRCTPGLVEGNDTLHFTSNVSRSFDFVDYQIKLKDEPFFKTFCHMDRALSEKRHNHCSMADKDGGVSVNISIAANSSVSEASIRGVWHQGPVTSESEIQTFPPIYDPIESGVDFQINGLSPPTFNCIMKLNESLVTVLFRCNCRTPCPCSLRLQDVAKNKTIQSDTGSIYYSAVMTGVLRLNLSFTFCHSANEMHFECFLSNDLSTNDTPAKDFPIKDSFTVYYKYVIPLTAVLVILLIVNFVFLCTFRRLIVKRIITTFHRVFTKPIISSITYEMAVTSLSLDYCIPHYTSLTPQQALLPRCSKSSRHGEFIDANELGIQHMPEKHGCESLLEFIQVVSSLTVQINCEKTSPSRVSQRWPDTNIPYPTFASENPTVSNSRSGSGRIWSVIKYTDGIDGYNSENQKLTHCPCASCNHSPSSTWGVIKMSTSASLVFNEDEAKSTKCRFSLDGKKYELTGFTNCSPKLKTDFCSLVVCNCDIELVDKLRALLERFKQLFSKIYKETPFIKTLHRFVFIVSYPHGDKRMVSLGRLLRIEKVIGVGSRLVYTAPTCPGSVGAPVTAIGYSDMWTDTTQFMHLGCQDQSSVSGVAYLYKPINQTRANDIVLFDIVSLE